MTIHISTTMRSHWLLPVWHSTTLVTSHAFVSATNATRFQKSTFKKPCSSTCPTITWKDCTTSLKASILVKNTCIAVTVKRLARFAFEHVHLSPNRYIDYLVQSAFLIGSTRVKWLLSPHVFTRFCLFPSVLWTMVLPCVKINFSFGCVCYTTH